METSVGSSGRRKSPSLLGRMVLRYEKRVAREMFHPTFPLGRITSPYHIISSHLWFYIKKFAARCEGRILDYGCGNMPYREFFSYTDYVSIEYGNPVFSTEEVICVRDANISFPDESFDAVLCNQLLEHAPADSEMMNRDLVAYSGPGPVSFSLFS